MAIFKRKKKHKRPKATIFYPSPELLKRIDEAVAQDHQGGAHPNRSEWICRACAAATEQSEA